MKYKRCLQNVSFLMLFCSLFLWGVNNTAEAQIFGHGEEVENPAVESSLLKTLQYRNIGPFRGGRSVAVAGHKDQPDTYYTGFTGGGVYKTEDGGGTWVNISDGYFKTGSVGAIVVAPSDPNVIYAGMGETCIRGICRPGTEFINRMTVATRGHI